LAALVDAPAGPSSSTPSDIVVIEDDDALERALALPEAAWRIFLHPRQRFIVDIPADQHILIKGGPGTGKTISLVHRFARLRHELHAAGRLPPTLLTLNEPMRHALLDGLRALGVELDDEHVLSAAALRGSLSRTLQGVGALLIDEAQDMRFGSWERCSNALRSHQRRSRL
jgi:AAA domain